MKKYVKNLMSAFLTFVMVLGIGAMPAFAAETDATAPEAVITTFEGEYQVPEDAKTVCEDVFEQQGNARTTFTTWVKFRSMVETRKDIYFSGSGVSCAMAGINSTSSNTFYVELYRYDNGTSTYISRSSNIGPNANNTTVTWQIDSPGYYFVRFRRTNDGIYQNIDTVTLVG